MSLTHVEWLLGFPDDYVVIGVGVVGGLGDGGVGLVIDGVRVLGGRIGVVFGLCFYLDFTIAVGGFVGFISIGYGALTPPIIISFLALNRHTLTFS